MTNQITEIEQAIADEITINAEGHGFISAKGVARLLGISNANLGVARFAKKLAETFTQQGLSLVERPFSEVALTLIAEYYAYLAQNTTEQARWVYRTMSAIGARTWMQKVKGWTEPPVIERPALPPSDMRIERLRSNLEYFKIDIDNPRFQQALTDIAGDILGVTPDQHALPGNTDRWAGVAEVAEEMGYPVAQVLVKRSSLGKWVSRHYKGDRRQEKRLCNGTQRQIWLYRVTPELEAAIRNYPRW